MPITTRIELAQDLLNTGILTPDRAADLLADSTAELITYGEYVRQHALAASGIRTESILTPAGRVQTCTIEEFLAVIPSVLCRSRSVVVPRMARSSSFGMNFGGVPSSAETWSSTAQDLTNRGLVEQFISYIDHMRVGSAANRVSGIIDASVHAIRDTGHGPDRSFEYDGLTFVGSPTHFTWYSDQGGYGALVCNRPGIAAAFVVLDAA